KLSANKQELLRRWIEQGARWSAHWAYVPPVRPAAPRVANSGTSQKNPVDAFILAELAKKGLKPNTEADRYTLIRRLSLDLTGLPPTIQEVDDYVADTSSRAYEKVVERLLASPHFGERLALAWLDQARYADTSGYHFDGFRQMHLWRDWVIQAFNGNKPFDQFTIEQLAGDLLPNATLEQKIATGFHRNVMTTDEGGVDPEEYMAKYQVDRASTSAQVWLGTTMGCAECHDHKFDPISTREFYQFFAFFNGIAEKGLDGTRTRNPGPVLKIPSPDQGSKLLRYLDQIPVAEKAVADREAELPKAQEKWEKELPAAQEPGIDGLVKELTFPPPPAGHGGEAADADNALESDQLRAVSALTNRFVPGRVGRAIRFDGTTNGFLDAGQAVHFERTNAFSYGAWVQLHGKTGAVLSKMEDGPGYRGFDLLINDGKPEVHLISKFPDNALKIASKDPVPTNSWIHLFVTYNGSNKAAGLKLYVDGRLRAVDAPNDTLSGTIANEAPLLIGARTNAFPFRGLVDGVRFYDRALSAEEILKLYAHPHLLLAHRPAGERTADERADLKKFFREHRAVEFIAARERLDKLQAGKKELLEKIPDTMVMEEMEKPRDTFILVRGNYQSKGEKVTPGTPACWSPLPKDQTANRLALARWIVSTNNPLTARVTVNRWWAMFFGTGLVKTANDFGSQGDRPSHPDLLDWLACEFMQGPAASNAVNATRHATPWDVKHLIRVIVTSATYRQSAVISREKLERDPYNRLLSRGPRLRLDAELVRDNALAISGLLDERIGGPSIKPYQPPGIWDVTDHKYEQSKGADLYRRGMYVLWKRAAHYPSFQTFDAPSRETCTLVRPRTSTPLQSLVVMNDPVYVEAARQLATRALREGGTNLSQQITYAFRLSLARPPERGELKVLEHTFQKQLDNFRHDEKAAGDLLRIGESARASELDATQLAAMTGVANVLLNLNETITR
ncbi:MAG: hypothetical protein QOF48_3401, partial [Verrucomicrobiota bacterium]